MVKIGQNLQKKLKHRQKKVENAQYFEAKIAQNRSNKMKCNLYKGK